QPSVVTEQPPVVVAEPSVTPSPQVEQGQSAMARLEQVTGLTWQSKSVRRLVTTVNAATAHEAGKGDVRMHKNHVVQVLFDKLKLYSPYGELPQPKPPRNVDYGVERQGTDENPEYVFSLSGDPSKS